MFIQEYRARYRLSREALGKLAGCSGTLIYILESGGITHPGIADRITSVCDGGKNERNSIVAGAHWREGWKQTPKYRARGEKAEKAYFLRLAREKMEAEAREQSIRQADACQLPLPKGAEGQQTGTGQQTGAGQRTEVCAINRKGEIIGRYPDAAEAARRYVLKTITVLKRCEHRLGENTNEYTTSGVTFRFAAEWDKLSADERLMGAVHAAGRSYMCSARKEYSWQGQTHSVAEWARIAGMTRQTLQSRLKSGWGIEKALKTPLQNQPK